MNRMMNVTQLPTTPPLAAEKWQTAGREGGRRFVVRNQAGAVLHDTGDQYDIGNALHNLDRWLQEQIEAGNYDMKS